MDTSPREHDIADLSGGRRPSLSLSGAGLNPAVLLLMVQRDRQFQYLRRKGKLRTGTVYFSDIILPGDPPDKSEIE